MRRVLLGVTALVATVATTVTGTASGQSVATGSVSGFWRQAAGVATVHAAADDPAFYRAPEGVDLATLPPGTVLKERTITAHVASIDVPLRVTQLLYTTSDALGVPSANVTSVIEPPGPADGNVVSYQSFYDSLNPADHPSRYLAGNMTVGGITTTMETLFVAPSLLTGHRVVLSDTEGPAAEFAAGPAYGRATLDSLRAASRSPLTGIGPQDKIGLFGYSGGAIASNWAAILLRDYAPELAPRIVGLAQGGVLVDPIHNLGYAGEGIVWSPVVAMALIGIARAYHVDIEQYLNENGRRIYADVRNLSIVEAFGRYPHVRWADIADPAYPTPQDAPELMRIADSLDMGAAPVPGMPMMIHQGAGGWIEGTPAELPGVGHGDGIMVVGDVRSLARKYCAAGTPVEYREYPWLSHALTTLPWVAESFGWLEARFHGAPATNNCATIPEGNPIG